MATSRTGTAKWKTLRARLIAERDHVCHWCGKNLDASAPRGSHNAIEVDHVIPVLLAPHLDHDPTNLVLVCHPCNRRKGTKQQPTAPVGPVFDIHGMRVLDPSRTCKVHAPILSSCPHSRKW